MEQSYRFSTGNQYQKKCFNEVLPKQILGNLLQSGSEYSMEYFFGVPISGLPPLLSFEIFDIWSTFEEY
jgi:hypothetical protein